MRAAPRALVDELASRPAAAPERGDAEACELLEWLADDHFTFLGYREYMLARRDDGTSDVLRAVPGTGLGILRSDPRSSTARSAAAAGGAAQGPGAGAARS